MSLIRNPSRGASTLGLVALLAIAMGNAATAAAPANDEIHPVATDILRPVEQTFLEKAATLSREQLQLARLAVSQAASSDVRTFAQELVADHRQISDSLEALRQKKGALLEPQATAPAVDAYQQLEQRSGNDFDREFIRVSSQREAAVLALFEAVLADATDPDIRDLIGSYLPTLRDHRNRATELRKTLE